MTVLFRCRIEKRLLDEANRVTESLGTSTPEMVRIFVTQMARTGRVPLKLDPNVEDSVAGPWENRTSMLGTFCDPSKAW